MNLKYIVAIVVSISVLGIILSLYVQGTTNLVTQNDTPTISAFSASEHVQTTNGIKHIVPLDEIKSGGPPKDGIPSIDKPKFVDASEANFISDDELIIGLNINGQKKAYPLFILVWHEIVNDEFGDAYVAVTYCPLCFTSQVFDRMVDGQVTEFGTSGKLYNSNLVMYDRNTDSMWSQALGKAIVGKLTGYELKKVPFDLARWSDWKSRYPDTLILTTETGFSRPYGVDPYGDYYTNPQVIFPVKNRDDRMHPKEIILGFDTDAKYKSYKIADVESEEIINDTVGGKNIVLVSVAPYMVRAFERTVDGQTLEFVFDNAKIKDKQTGTLWNLEGIAISGPLQGKNLQRVAYSPGFWFEWVAFHPETEVYETS